MLGAVLAAIITQVSSKLREIEAGQLEQRREIDARQFEKKRELYERMLGICGPIPHQGNKKAWATQEAYWRTATAASRSSWNRLKRAAPSNVAKGILKVQARVFRPHLKQEQALFTSRTVIWTTRERFSKLPRHG